MKLSLIYNSDIRNNGTPVHFWHAFKGLGTDFKRYSPKGELPPADFYLYLDDGRDEIKWLPPHPRGYYATDTHLGWDYRFWKASQMDITWCAQKDAAEKMQAEGLNAHWLPLAANPTAHPTRGEYQERLEQSLPLPSYNLAFVGHLQAPEQSNRVEFLDAVFSSSQPAWFAYGCFHEEMARHYFKARLGLNHAVRRDLNMRFFELASIGVPQLCDRRMWGLLELGFVEGIDYLGYSSTEEAINQVQRAQQMNGELDQMARSAHEKVRTRHTYTHRAQKILEDVEGICQS